MTIQKKIDTACAYAGITKTELAKSLGYTPQAFYQRMKTGKFTEEELETIAKTLGAIYISCFKFPDGQEF